MLTKILFTLAVILVVALVFRVKNTPVKPGATQTQNSKGGVSAAMVAYTLLGLVIAISALVFVLQDQHKVIDIQVTNSQGNALKYQAYKKAIEGRRFTTIDGVSVDLADSDRIEILENKD